MDVRRSPDLLNPTSPSAWAIPGEYAVGGRSMCRCDALLTGKV